LPSIPRYQLIRLGLSPWLPPNDCFRVFLDAVDLHLEPEPVIHPCNDLLLCPFDSCQLQLHRRLSLWTLHNFLLNFDREGCRIYHLSVGYRYRVVSARHRLLRNTCEQTGCGKQNACCNKCTPHFSILLRGAMLAVVTVWADFTISSDGQ